VLEEVGRRVPEIEARVKTLVGERFDAEAEKLVRARVERAIAEVRAKL
jgi:hypothetical protein